MKSYELRALTPNLMVDDVEKTVKFYTKVLGFQVVMTVPDQKTQKLNWALLNHGPVNIMFQKRESLIEEYSSLIESSIGKGLTVFIQVADIEFLYETLQDQATIIKDLMVTFYGMKEFAIADCNGYILTFAQQQ